MGYIYKITNLINHKMYIGYTTQSIEERWKQHQKKAKVFTNRYLYDAMNHYGIENFSIEEIEQCDDDSLLKEREIYWIAQLNTYYLDDNSQGYNMTRGGDGGNTWTANPHQEETSKKLSKSLTGKKHSEETKKLISKMKKGKHVKSIDEDALFLDIKNGLSIQELCEKYQISEWTIRMRCKEKFNCSYGDLREQPIHRKQYVLSEAARQERIGRFVGEKNGSYKAIPQEDLLTDIKNQVSADNICKKYNISKTTLYKKCQEYFHKSLKELRKEN